MASDKRAESASLAQDSARAPSYFGRLAATYGGGSYYSSRREAVLGALKPELELASKVLDLGCGNGGYLAEFAKLAHLVFICGADLSTEMIVEARKRLGRTFPLLAADACAPPFSAGRFDLVFCSHVLPFTSDLPRAVSEIARILAPAGVLATTVGGSSVTREMRKLMTQEKWEQFERIAFNRAAMTANTERGAARYESAFTDAGLAIETRAAPFFLRWKDVADWMRLRWLPMADKNERQIAAAIMDETLRPMLDDQVEFSEILMLGRKS